MKTQMKCRKMRHFIRVCTVPLLAKINKSAQRPWVSQLRMTAYMETGKKEAGERLSPRTISEGSLFQRTTVAG